MKFYIAAKWQSRAEVRTLMNLLEARGHTITVDWTTHVNPQNQSILQEWAERDEEGVKQCDIFIGLFRESEVGNGAVVEMGIALGLGKRIWIVGDAIDSCIFMLHPLVTKFPNIEAMLYTLDSMPKE